MHNTKFGAGTQNFWRIQDCSFTGLGQGLTPGLQAVLLAQRCSKEQQLCAGTYQNDKHRWCHKSPDCSILQ